MKKSLTESIQNLNKIIVKTDRKHGVVTALQNPTRVLAALGQKIGDTVEEEGIAYSISYVAADVAIQILLSKGLGEVKNVSKADDLVDVARTVDTLRTHLRRVNLTGADLQEIL